MSKITKTLYAKSALLAKGWKNNVAIEIDEHGLIANVSHDLSVPPNGAEIIDGIVIPGVPNCHSHAFQRAMVGLTEIRGSSDDSFWSWRDVMYRSVGAIGPEELQAITEQLYIEMLKLGYTGVAEFHYLHHDINGQPYADPAEMSRRIIAAAETAGIQVTLLPVLYAYSDFGAKPPQEGQRRFIHSLEAYQSLIQCLHSDYVQHNNVNVGIAPHSLRAVDKPMLEGAIAALDKLNPLAPIHIHIAEQMREVKASLAHSGARPIEWLLDNIDVNPRWCLVHATHMTRSERSELAASGAVAGLCLTTEANLGDGIFPAVEYLQEGGRFAVGSDSQVTLSPAEELRLLEYGQRLVHQKRALLASEGNPSVGENLYRKALSGGAQALGINTGAICADYRADLLVLDQNHPSLMAKEGSAVLDSWVFAGAGNPVKDVMVSGEWKILGGKHSQQEQVASRFHDAMKRLLT